jgi:hypothetical protein
MHGQQNIIFFKCAQKERGGGIISHVLLNIFKIFGLAGYVVPNLNMILNFESKNVWQKMAETIFRILYNNFRGGVLKN